MLSEREADELPLEEAINLSEQEVQSLIQEEDGLDVQEAFATNNLFSLIENDLDKLLNW